MAGYRRPGSLLTYGEAAGIINQRLVDKIQAEDSAMLRAVAAGRKCRADLRELRRWAGKRLESQLLDRVA